MSDLLRELTILPMGPPGDLEARLAAIRDRLVGWDEERARRELGAPSDARLLKSTISLCPECLESVPALVVERSGRAWMHKRCDEHGLSTVLVENDAGYQLLSNRDRWGRRYADLKEHVIPDFVGPASGCCEGGACGPQDFADQLDNKSCTVLVEVTDACNLSCPACYADAKGERALPVDELRDRLKRLVVQKGVVDSVQLTGGEATVHPHFWDLLDVACAQDGILRVYLPTNGIFFTKPENVERLKAYRGKLMVLLQFDGFRDATDVALRDARLADVRRRVLDAMSEADVAVQLTMTVARDVNLDEVGAVVAEGMRRRNVRLVALQPVTWSGRYDLPTDPGRRVTLSDLVKEVSRHANQRVREGDFVPIPCSHPGCGWISLWYRRFGLFENVMKHVDLEAVLDDVAAKTVLDTDGLRKTVGSRRGRGLRHVAGAALRRFVRPKDVFSVAIKPFMDRYTYDQDRISSCCHHLLGAGGDLVSFCEYNARIRPKDDWSRWPRAARAPGVR